ncbi:hypothetical protein HanPI659440_Chr13g0484571 [Helianthus annuus]|nr:hypothetical protein HanPI659440_Chr13g0484571 [Helianthus annuus]
MMTYKCLATIDDDGMAMTVEGKFKPATRLEAMVCESSEPHKAQTSNLRFKPATRLEAMVSESSEP